MHGHITGSEFAAWTAIAVVLAAGLGLGLAVLGGRLAARRAARPTSAAPAGTERWKRS